MSRVLDCSGITVRFGTVTALSEADLPVERGEIVALLGPSGCGKTTLLRAIAGFQRVDAGTITVEDRLVESPSRHVPPHQRPVGMVFQDFALFPHLSVEANIGYGLGRGEDRKRRVAELLELAGLSEMGRRYPHQLSAGQQQRVAILRSLAPRPAVLLLDEPFSNLDPATHALLRSQVADLLRAQDVTAILVTHDRSDAFAAADRVAVMQSGRMLQLAAPEELYFRPASPDVARAVGSVQFLDGVSRDGCVDTVLGRLQASGPIADGRCSVLVRPEWIVERPGGVRARVLSSRLEGELTRLTVAAGDASLVMLVPSGALRLGSDIELAVSVPVPAFPV